MSVRWEKTSPKEKTHLSLELIHTYSSMHLIKQFGNECVRRWMYVLHFDDSSALLIYLKSVNFLTRSKFCWLVSWLRSSIFMASHPLWNSLNMTAHFVRMTHWILNIHGIARICYLTVDGHSHRVLHIQVHFDWFSISKFIMFDFILLIHFRLSVWYDYYCSNSSIIFDVVTRAGQISG